MNKEEILEKLVEILQRSEHTKNEQDMIQMITGLISMYNDTTKKLDALESNFKSMEYAARGGNAFHNNAVLMDVSAQIINALGIHSGLDEYMVKVENGRYRYENLRQISSALKSRSNIIKNALEVNSNV